jgi:hypothetical protein
MLARKRSESFGQSAFLEKRPEIVPKSSFLIVFIGIFGAEERT